MHQPGDEPQRPKPETFPDWDVVRRMLSALVVLAMLGYVLALLVGWLDTPRERRLRSRHESFEREQTEALRRSEEAAKKSEIRLKQLEREIFGPDRK